MKMHIQPPDICRQETRAILIAITDWHERAIHGKARPLSEVIYEIVKGFNQHRDDIAYHYRRIANEALALVPPPVVLPNQSDLIMEPNLTSPACGIDCQAGCALGYKTLDECFAAGRRWSKVEG